MIIDFHTHVFPSRVRQNREKYLQRDRCFAELFGSPKAKLSSAEELIAGMERDGVDFCVMLNYGWATHELCVEINDYILEAAARYPQKLAGFCAIQPSSPAAVRELERCIQGGARGVGEMRPDLQGFSLDDKNLMEPFIELMREHNLPFLSHASEPVGHVYPGKGSLTPDRLYPFIAAHPDLTVVLAHWGGGLPFYALMPEVKAALKNVYYDSAASPFLYRPEIYRQVCALAGADRVLFGSDYPLLPHSRLISEIKNSGLSEPEKGLVLGDNARRLLGIKV